MSLRSTNPAGSSRYPRLDMSQQFEEFINEFDRAFSLPSLASSANSADFTPPLDVEERQDAYCVAVDLPGLRREDISLDISENVLTISGERVRDASGEGRYAERPYGRFERRVMIPAQVDVSKIDAHFVAGVLNVTLPKYESVKVHSIKVL